MVLSIDGKRILGSQLGEGDERSWAATLSPEQRGWNFLVKDDAERNNVTVSSPKIANIMSSNTEARLGCRDDGTGLGGH
jgi:hypothetical protein